MSIFSSSPSRTIATAKDMSWISMMVSKVPPIPCPSTSTPARKFPLTGSRTGCYVGGTDEAEKSSALLPMRIPIGNLTYVAIETTHLEIVDLAIKKCFLREQFRAIFGAVVGATILDFPKNFS